MAAAAANSDFQWTSLRSSLLGLRFPADSREVAARARDQFLHHKRVDGPLFRATPYTRTRGAPPLKHRPSLGRDELIAPTDDEDAVVAAPSLASRLNAGMSEVRTARSLVSEFLATEEVRSLPLEFAQTVRSMSGVRPVASSGNTELDLPLLDNGQLQLIDSFQPALRAGEYLITSDQTFSTPDIPEFKATQTVVVDGPHFSLPAGSVVSQYPAVGGCDVYQRTMPHVLLTDPHIMWERYPTMDQTTLPWLGLIVLTPTEILTEEPLLASAPPLTPSYQQSPSLARTMAVSDFLNVANHSKKLYFPLLTKEADPNVSYVTDREAIAAQTLQCQVVVVNSTAIDLEFFPTVEDFASFAHCRRSNTDDDGHNTDLHSVAIAPRLGVMPASTAPNARQLNCVHLVSLQGLREMQARAKTPNSDKVGFVLLSLYSWTFECVPDPERIDFKKLALNLTPQSLSLSWPMDKTDPTPPPVVAERLAQGFVPVAHRFRSGQTSVAWMRGPLSAVQTAQESQASTDPPQPGPETFDQLLLTSPAGDDLLILEQNDGIFDVTYSSAWQLGRALSMSNPDVIGALTRIRQSTLAKCLQRLHAAATLSTDHIGASALDLLHTLAHDSVSNHPQSLKGDQRNFRAELRQRVVDDAPPVFPAATTASAVDYTSRVPARVVTALTPAALQDELMEHASHVTTSLLSTINLTDDADVLIVMKFLAQLRLLKGIPASYLLPNPNLLPTESIRFFYVDSRWMRALYCGALAPVQHTLADAAIKGALINRLSTSDDNGIKVDTTVPATQPLIGVLLRSTIISALPTLIVKMTYDKLGAATPTECTPVRLDHITPGVLLAIYEITLPVPDGMQLIFSIAEPRQHPHFGVEVNNELLMRYTAPGTKPSVHTGMQIGSTIGTLLINASLWKLTSWVVVPTLLTNIACQFKGASLPFDPTQSAQVALQLCPEPFLKQWEMPLSKTPASLVKSTPRVRNLCHAVTMNFMPQQEANDASTNYEHAHTLNESAPIDRACAAVAVATGLYYSCRLTVSPTVLTLQAAKQLQRLTLGISKSALLHTDTDAAQISATVKVSSGCPHAIRRSWSAKVKASPLSVSTSASSLSSPSSSELLTIVIECNPSTMSGMGVDHSRFFGLHPLHHADAENETLDVLISGLRISDMAGAVDIQVTESAFLQRAIYSTPTTKTPNSATSRSANSSPADLLELNHSITLIKLPASIGNVRVQNADSNLNANGNITGTHADTHCLVSSDQAMCAVWTPASLQAGVQLESMKLVVESAALPHHDPFTSAAFLRSRAKFLCRMSGRKASLSSSYARIKLSTDKPSSTLPFYVLHPMQITVRADIRKSDGQLVTLPLERHLNPLQHKLLSAATAIHSFRLLGARVRDAGLPSFLSWHATCTTVDADSPAPKSAVDSRIRFRHYSSSNRDADMDVRVPLSSRGLPAWPFHPRSSGLLSFVLIDKTTSTLLAQHDVPVHISHPRVNNFEGVQVALGHPVELRWTSRDCASHDLTAICELSASSVLVEPLLLGSAMQAFSYAPPADAKRVRFVLRSHSLTAQVDSQRRPSSSAGDTAQPTAGTVLTNEVTIRLHQLSDVKQLINDVTYRIREGIRTPSAVTSSAPQLSQSLTSVEPVEKDFIYNATVSSIDPYPYFDGNGSLLINTIMPTVSISITMTAMKSMQELGGPVKWYVNTDPNNGVALTKGWLTSQPGNAIANMFVVRNSRLGVAVPMSRLSAAQKTNNLPYPRSPGVMRLTSEHPGYVGIQLDPLPNLRPENADLRENDVLTMTLTGFIVAGVPGTSYMLLESTTQSNRTCQLRLPIVLAKPSTYQLSVIECMYNDNGYSLEHVYSNNFTIPQDCTGLKFLWYSNINPEYFTVQNPPVVQNFSADGLFSHDVINTGDYGGMQTYLLQKDDLSKVLGVLNGNDITFRVVTTIPVDPGSVEQEFHLKGSK